MGNNCIQCTVWRIVFLYVDLIVNSIITEDIPYSKVFNISEETEIRINCGHSFIKIDTLAVSTTTTTCLRQGCILYPEDVNNTRRQCDGRVSCTLDLNWTDACFHEIEYPKVNVTYYCRVPAFIDLDCHFEKSFCNWNPAKEGIQWTITAGQAETIPEVDHTTGEGYGKYAYVKAESPGANNRLAQIESGLIETLKDKCMTLWYYMDGELTIYQRNKTVDKYNKVTISKNQMPDQWTKGVFLLSGTGSYNVVIEGTPKHRNGFIALDDINVVDGNCSTTPYSYCNFEKPLKTCGLDILSGDKTWEKQKGGFRSDNRPLKDHTTDSVNGSYLLFQWNNLEHSSNRTSAIIKDLTTGRKKCFSLWYYMIGRHVGTLNISGLNYQNKTDHYRSIPNDNQNKWRQVYISMYEVKQIILEYQFIPNNAGAIALDDIYISDGECTVKSFNSNCLGLHDEVKFECPVQDVIEPEFTFNPPLQTSRNCTTENAIRDSAEKRCQTFRDNNSCIFNLSDLIPDIDVCFALKKQLLIEYSCTVSDSAVSHTEQSTTSYSAGSAVGRTETSKSYSAVVTDSLAENQNQGSSNSTGLTAGVVIAVCIIVVIGVVIVIFIRRRSLSANEKTNHNIDGRNTDDYIGNQSNALPPTNGHVKTVSTKNNYNDLESRYDKQNYTEIKEDGFPQEVTGKTQHDYIDICPENKVAEQKTTAVQPQQNEIGYTCLDPAETGFNRMKATKQELEKANSSAKNTGLFTNSDNLDESKIDTKTLHPVTPENYTILDPNETGFDRSKSPEHRASPYELAKPIQNHENDPYCLSKEGEYDSTSNIHHKETDENVYSHSVENVYDSARFTRDKDGKDDTYDHFFGQKTEDDYDISKST